MASKYAYRSVGTQYGFRVNATTKLMFAKTEDTPVDESEAIACEDYVASGHLERIGDNPLANRKAMETPTTVKGPGGVITTKGAAPNVDARVKEKEADKPPAKK